MKNEDVTLVYAVLCPESLCAVALGTTSRGPDGVLAGAALVRGRPIVLGAQLDDDRDLARRRALAYARRRGWDPSVWLDDVEVDYCART